MKLMIMVLLDLGIFSLITAVVWYAGREIEARYDVGRRLRGEASAKPQTRAATSLIRQQSVRSPFLAWIQGTFLTDSKEKQSLTRSLHQAGFDSPSAPAIYKSIQIALAAILPAAFVITLKTSGTELTPFKTIAIIIGFVAFGYLGPYLYVNSRGENRKTALQDQFPDALDLMVVCVEAGLPLEAAFIRVGNDTVSSHPRISEEYRTVTEELQAGRTRQEALHSLANRTQVDVVKSFVALLIQTDSLGGSIAQSLRVYAAEMRQHRMLKAEEKAMRIPVLLSIPLVLCILPVIMTAVLLPAIIMITTGLKA